MTAPIGPLASVTPALAMAPLEMGPDLAGSAAVAAPNEAFAATLGGALESLQATQSKADGLAVEAATGSLQDVHEYTIAATEASLATQLTVAVRNKAVEAFNDIMRMPA
jgi:flagellar hook-basal body complex protein FliE